MAALGCAGSILCCHNGAFHSIAHYQYGEKYFEDMVGSYLMADMPLIRIIN